MQRPVLPGWLAVVLGLWILPVTGVAQDGEDAQPPEEASADEALQEDDSGPAEDSEADDAVADEQQDEGATTEPSSADDDTGEDLSQEDEEERAAEEEQETVVGPGGAPLDTDYPGTEESLQPRMDTGRVVGMEIPEGQTGEEVYDLRVRELETQIDDLKERVFRSKSRIALLRETVLAENLAGSRAIITFEDDLGSRYNIERAIFSVDGNQVFSSLDTEAFSDEVEVFSGALTPGTHTVSVTLGLRGSSYGVFSYAEGYEFDLRFSCQFTAEEGRTTLVTVQSYKGGNTLTAHEERPDGMCHVSTVELDIEDVEGEIDGEEIPSVD